MLAKTQKKKVVIVGSGISGATAAKTLAASGMNKEDIIILEKDNRTGGKLRTYSDKLNPQLKAEYGAGVMTSNYGIIDTLAEKNIQPEVLLATRKNTVEIMDDMSKLSLLGKAVYSAKFLWQSMKFASSVWSYNRAHANLQETLPADMEKPFSEYVKKNNMQQVATFLKFLVPGFGYGSYDDEKSYTYKILDYMGYTTIPGLGIDSGSLVAIHNGYQQVIEKTLENFDVQTSATINKIDRNDKSVKVSYTQNNQQYEIEADLLVVATSPANWNSLGMKLTCAEQQCVDQTTYFRYPVAICKLKGIPAEQIYVRDAIEKEGFGHAAFLFTRDNRTNPEDGRLFTVYINIPRENKDYNLTPGGTEFKSLEEDLRKIGATDVQILDSVIWEDYNPTLPYKTGVTLQKEEQHNATRTLHLGGYMPGSFETVAGNEQYARKTIEHYMHKTISLLAESYQNLKRTYTFFSLPRALPLTDTLEDTDQHRIQANIK